MLVRRGETLPKSWEGFADYPVSVLLESGRAGRYTYLCDRPERVVLGREDGAEVWSGDGEVRLGWTAGKPLEVLASLLNEATVPVPDGWPAMTGGFIGAFGYDLVHAWEQLPRQAKRDLTLPLYAMVEPRELFIYDRDEQTLGIVVWRNVGAADSNDLTGHFDAAHAMALDAYARWKAGGGRAPIPEWRPLHHTEIPSDSFNAEGFQEAVRRVQDYITAGHTYQTNLSLRTSRPAPAAAEVIYESVRRVNPSPYMGLLRLPDFALVCGSPELLVRMVDRTVVSRPIAGTRPRGDLPAHDVCLAAELLVNEKERAEHLMLVDLIRNDIGRVVEWGSVRVREFMTIERYSHVMHLVSEVEGRLAAGKSWVELLQSMFPGGTITGCPKIRTMEIIEELEPVGRGFYTGSLGWISYHGDLEMNIIIRSMLVQAGVAHVQAGAGIVADSQPEREFDEATRKAQALWVALELASVRQYG
ncbi:MAG: anthranilate synthase component I family protein [Opitutaceae bacterium]|nr:anthranilate synthase component I family protein [Opitutaceae bacterium]